MSPVYLMSPAITSRLPHVGLTIFSRMSALARQYNAVNLGQGFPDFSCDPELIASVTKAMEQGHNQYASMTGTAELRQAVVNKIVADYGQRYHVDDEITITAGATQALHCAIMCCVGVGDEVIIIEPAYDSYIPAITMAGGVVKAVPMEMVHDDDGSIDRYCLPFAGIEATISTRTRLIIINTPHNPTGTVWAQKDMQRLQELVRGTSILICSDEVYEHMVFDGERHESVTRYPELAARSFVVSSFGKTFHTTGWKLGYVVAPAPLMLEFRKLHQYIVFSVNTPMQHGISHYLTHYSNAYRNLPAFYQQKRDTFRVGLVTSNFKLLPCEGTYFQSVDYSALPIAEAKLDEFEFAQWLTSEIGVAAIPMSAFYSAPCASRVVRFCFAKKEETLQTALLLLNKI